MEEPESQFWGLRMGKVTSAHARRARASMANGRGGVVSGQLCHCVGDTSRSGGDCGAVTQLRQSFQEWM